MTAKSRFAQVVLAVLSSVVLTALVVVPLALGARSARSDDRQPTPRATRVVDTTPTTAVVTVPGSEDRSPSTTTVDGTDDDGSDSLPPRVPIQVLPSTETRGDGSGTRGGPGSGDDTDTKTDVSDTEPVDTTDPTSVGPAGTP